MLEYPFYTYWPLATEQCSNDIALQNVGSSRPSAYLGTLTANLDLTLQTAEIRSV